MRNVCLAAKRMDFENQSIPPVPAKVLLRQGQTAMLARIRLVGTVRTAGILSLAVAWSMAVPVEVTPGQEEADTPVPPRPGLPGHRRRAFRHA